MDLLERGQGFWNVVKSDTDPGIHYLKYITAAFPAPDFERYLATGVRELDGVGEKVHQDLFHFSAVGP